MKNKMSFKDKMNQSLSSWKQLLNFYKKVKIPWGIVLLVLVFSIAMKEIESSMVPFKTKIMTGAIAEAGFLGGFIAITIFYNFMEAIQGGINEFGNVRMTRNVRKSVWQKLIHLPMSTYDSENKQSFVSRVTQDTTGAYAAITVTVQMIAIIYGIYTNFVKMLRIYKMLAFIMLAMIPLTFYITYICGKMQFSMENIIITSVSRITNFFAERLPNINHIKVNTMEDEEYLKGIEANEAKYKADIKYWNIFIIQGPLSSLSQYLNEIILLIVASALVRAGVMKMTQLVNLFNYFLMFMGNAIMLTAVWQSVKKSHGSCSTIARLMDLENENMEDGIAFKDQLEDITFENVSFSYVEGMDVLKDASFIIPKGKVSVIVGENGSGKSTIVKLLERFNETNSGNIMVGNHKLKDINLYDWRHCVGHLFQRDQIVKGSIRDNVCYGLNRKVSDEEIIEALKEAKAYDFVMSKEEGLNTEISTFTSKLSGGEEQRLAIARILLKDPEYLIMDEATSGIDVVNSEDVIHTIFETMKDKTIIMISHDMNLIKKADHIIVLNEGVVEASGTYSEVLCNSKLFKEFEG